MEKKSKQYWMNMTMAVVAGQAGCLTLVILMAAILLGLWLDNQFATRPAMTIAAVLISIPVSLFVMFIVVRAAVSRIKAQPGSKENQAKEVKRIGTTDED